MEGTTILEEQINTLHILTMSALVLLFELKHSSSTGIRAPVSLGADRSSPWNLLIRWRPFS